MTASKKAACLAALALTISSGCVPDTGGLNRAAATRLNILSAEDGRPTEGAALVRLRASLEAGDPVRRALAARALGRLESMDHVGHIAPLLTDANPSVRASAAHALAQSVHRTSGKATLEALIAAAQTETDGDVRRELARSLGRLNLEAGDTRRVVTALLDLSSDQRPTTLVGVALAFEALSRSAQRSALDGRVLSRLEALTTFGVGLSDDEAAPRVRSLAVSTLGQLGRLDATTLLVAVDDVHPSVRAAGVRFGSLLPANDRVALYRRALADEAPTVRVAAIIGLGAASRTSETCSELLVAAATNDVEAVQILASDALAAPCAAAGAQIRVLGELASAIPRTGDVGWQVPARAFAALARIDPARGDALLPRYVNHPNHFVRAYGAVAAGVLGTESALRSLAADEHPNVRVAALQPLFAARGHSIDALLIEQLSTDDPQLLMVTAGLLEGSPLGSSAASAALEAFERISGAQRETWRDSRMALLGRIAELGDAELGARLEPFLRDYDPVVAREVAMLLTEWTGVTRMPEPQPLRPAPLPTALELTQLPHTTVTLHMLRGGEIVIRPLADLAPTNAHRFVRLARSGYFDLLTFHRWAPNFVIQGGSPGANEYSGDGAYSRDEVGRLSHWRGTVGLSTRGHDTGDGQIFINLLDNVRLDHDYTIYGEVVEGMDVVDRILEGDVIERATVRVEP